MCCLIRWLGLRLENLGNLIILAAAILTVLYRYRITMKNIAVCFWYFTKSDPIVYATLQ